MSENINKLLKVQQSLGETLAANFLPSWEQGEFKNMMQIVICSIQREEKKVLDKSVSV